MCCLGGCGSAGGVSQDFLIESLTVQIPAVDVSSGKTPKPKLLPKKHAWLQPLIGVNG